MFDWVLHWRRRPQSTLDRRRFTFVVYARVGTESLKVELFQEPKERPQPAGTTLRNILLRGMQYIKGSRGSPEEQLMPRLQMNVYYSRLLDCLERSWACEFIQAPACLEIVTP